MNWRLVAIEAAAAVLLAATARADTLHFAASLSGAAQAPPARPSGNLWADLDTHSRLLTYRLTYRGLSGPATGARLQGPAKPGQSPPPAVALADAMSPITGKATLTAAEAADLRRGLFTALVATATNPQGEIRGQLKPQDDAGQPQSSPDPVSGRQDQPAPTSAQLGSSPQLSW